MLGADGSGVQAAPPTAESLSANGAGVTVEYRDVVASELTPILTRGTGSSPEQHEPRHHHHLHRQQQQQQQFSGTKMGGVFVGGIGQVEGVLPQSGTGTPAGTPAGTSAGTPPPQVQQRSDGSRRGEGDRVVELPNSLDSSVGIGGANLLGYRRVNREREPTPDNEIRVMSNGRVAKYVIYATRLLKEQQLSQGTAGLTIRALGRAVPVAISVCELMKRRTHSEYKLYQVTTIGWSTVVDSYEPIQPGLEQRQHRRSVPAISIFLSSDADAVDKTAPGYQEPLDDVIEKEDRLLTPPLKRPLARASRRGAPAVAGPETGQDLKLQPIATAKPNGATRFTPRPRRSPGAPVTGPGRGNRSRLASPLAPTRGLPMPDTELRERTDGPEGDTQFLLPQQWRTTTTRLRGVRRGRRGMLRRPPLPSPQLRVKATGDAEASDLPARSRNVDAPHEMQMAVAG